MMAKQIKNTSLRVYELKKETGKKPFEKLVRAQTQVFWEIVTDSLGKEWIAIPLTITQVGSDNYNQKSWKSKSGDSWTTFGIEPFTINFLNGITKKSGSQTFPLGGKQIEIEDLELCYKNQNNEIKNTSVILHKGAKVIFYLAADWYLEEYSYKEEINDNFSLVVRGDYKIISQKTGKTLVSFTNQNFVNAQELANQTYPNPQEIKSINLSDKYLKGSLNLNQFTNLEVLNLSNNQLSEIEVSQCGKLKNLDLRQNNNLTKLTVGSLSQFQRLKADSGELKKSSFFGGKSEWEPSNVGDMNVAPLRITQTKLVKNTVRVQFQGPASSQGYYLFMDDENKTKLEISQKNPVFKENKPAMKGDENGNNCLWYEISWEGEIDKKLFGEKDLLEVKETELEEDIWRTFDPNEISIFDIWENNPKYAGVIKQKSWVGGNFSDNLNSAEFSQVKKEVIQQIAQNPTEWEIREELETDLLGLTSKEKVVLLVHKAVQIKRESYGNIKIECGKTHYKKGFAEEEWTKIEGIIKKDQENLVGETKKWYQKPINYFWGGVIVVVVLVIFLGIRKLFKK